MNIRESASYKIGLGRLLGGDDNLRLIEALLKKYFQDHRTRDIFNFLLLLRINSSTSLCPFCYLLDLFGCGSQIHSQQPQSEPNLRSFCDSIPDPVNYHMLFAVADSIVGIFVPLGVWKWRTRKGRSTSVGYRGWYALYFAGLGFGYILVELNLIQKFSLFLGHPVYALSVTLAGLLIFSGIGSYLSRCISWQPRSILTIFFFIILSIVVVMALPKLLFQILAGSQVWIRALSTLVVIGPLGILMGMPFPLCLKQVGRDKPQLIPWLWGVNGFTSVIGSVLATIIAITYGYSAVTVTASSAYIIALIAGVLLARKGVANFPVG